MISAHGYAAHDRHSPLTPWPFERRDPGPRDVHIRILFCGVCHSDLHVVRSELGNTRYPLVAGHEIVGRVVSIGGDVTKFATDDLVGVGCLVDSCRTCASCGEGLEQYCENGSTSTYGAIDRHTGQVTQGGYSDVIVVDERFVLRIPPSLDPASAAPLLCAGITTFSPLQHWGVGTGSRVGIVGLGGLGHMGVKLARAMGAHVVLFTSTPAKAADAERLGAHEVVVGNEKASFKQFAKSLDLILDTVAAPHELTPELQLLKRDGALVLLGLSAVPHPSPAIWPFIGGRRRLAGSYIGGLPETQAMLDFCAAHGLSADIERIAIDQINVAYERMLRSDVKYRFVIDMYSS